MLAPTLINNENAPLHSSTRQFTHSYCESSEKEQDFRFRPERTEYHFLVTFRKNNYYYPKSRVLLTTFAVTGTACGIFKKGRRKNLLRCPKDIQKRFLIAKTRLDLDKNKEHISCPSPCIVDHYRRLVAETLVTSGEYWCEIHCGH